MADKITKEEFDEWLHNPVTESLYLDTQEKIDQEMWALVEVAGEKGYSDARSAGKVLAWGELFNWKPQHLLMNVDEIVEVDLGEDPE